jgi:beta-lactamase regulating signal transducer with metallopeptidase domain
MWVYTLLPKILNMSLTAGIVIIFVLLARVLLKKAPRLFSYVLWAVVLFRLVCPVSFSSAFSLIGIFHEPAIVDNSIAYIPEDIVYTEHPQVDLPLPIVSDAINGALPQDGEQLAADPLETPVAIATAIWLCGIAAMLLYSMISLALLRRRLIGAVHMRENIYLADHIATPFVLGVIRPRIYLPSQLSEHEQSYIILHEQTHIRRLDHIVKMIAFLTLAVHWFNPLVWLAFVCCVKDMEMSCDERVLKEMGGRIRKAYSMSLLSLAAGRRLINGSPLAFGEGNIKDRIKNVMNFKKPAVWAIAVLVVLVAALSVGFAANGAGKLALPDADSVTAIELEQFNNNETVGQAIIEGKTEISAILYAISGATKTHAPSVNDSPTADNYLVVRLKLADAQRTLYLYTDGGNYIEEPYSGTYRAGGTFDDVYAVYNAHLQADGTNHTQMTLDDVRSLAQKGDSLTFDDFKAFEGVDVSSSTAAKIMLYGVEGGYRLIVHTDGSIIDTTSLESILKSSGSGIDIRYNDVDEFVKSNSSPKTADEKPISPEISLEQSIGPDNPSLDYASHKYIIFHGYFGMFVYDLQKQQIIRSLDLASLGCQDTQGSNACEVVVSADGGSVFMRTMETKKMYVWDLTVEPDLSLYTASYDQDWPEPDACFQTVDINVALATENVSDIGAYSYSAAAFLDSDGGYHYGYLYFDGMTLGGMQYVVDATTYRLFASDSLPS